ncbi:MAG: hypothetical protein R2759_20685 [Bacteroidales bacterium]
MPWRRPMPWSVFTRILTDANGIYQFSAQEAAWVFSAGLATFAVVMVLAGKWYKSGPTIVAFTGGLVLGLGYILGGLFEAVSGLSAFLYRDHRAGSDWLMLFRSPWVC